eukprot:s2893_g6.t1
MHRLLLPWVLAVLLLRPVSGQSNSTDDGFDLSSLEPFLDQVADLSFYTALTAFLGWLAQLCVTCVPTKWYAIHYLVSSYFGLLYLGYFVSIPLYGWPEDMDCPEYPHLGPSNVDHGLWDKFWRATYNNVMLAGFPYILIVVAMLGVGVVLLAPPVFVLAGCFLGLGRFSHFISIDLAAQIGGTPAGYKEDPDKEMGGKMTGLKKAYNEETEDQKPDDSGDSEMIPITRNVQVPWWTLSTLNYYLKLGPPDCCSGCNFSMLSFCWEFLSVFLTILLPSFLRFYLDFLFVLTIFRSFSFTFPDFSLPDFSLPDFDFEFPWFSFKLPTFTMPRFYGKCGSTGDMGTVLILAASVFTSSVIITSDIMVALSDRLRRGQMLTRSLAEHDDANQDKMRKYYVQAEAQIGTGALYVILWFTGIIMNQATLSFAMLVPRLVAGKEAADDATGCTWGMFFCVRFLQIYIMGCTVSYFFKVLSGSVHKDGIYILSAVLVQKQSLCSCSQLLRVFALVRLSIGQFLFPMMNVGLTSEDAGKIDEEVAERQRASAERQRASNQRLSTSLPKEEVLQLNENLSRTLTHIPDSRVGICVSLKKMFSAKQTLIETLTQMAEDKRGKTVVEAREQPTLRNFEDFRLREFTALILSRRPKKDEIKSFDDGADPDFEYRAERCCEKCTTVLTSPFTFMWDWQAKSAYVSERCCIWQSQLESVHKATCSSVALTILLIPIGGAFMCKSCQWLSEAPALLWSNVKRVCYYSFNWVHSEEGDSVAADCWCIGGFFMVLLRMGVAGIAFDNTTFWTLFQCACASAVLCLCQSWFMKKSADSNSVRIAEAILQERPGLQPQDLGPSRPGYGTKVAPLDEPQELPR